MSVAAATPSRTEAERRWRPYSNFRRASVPWLGTVPEHWTIKRLKYAVRLVNEKTEDPNGLPYVGLEHIESWTGRYIEPEIPVQPDGISNIFAPDDVLFGKLRPYLAKVLHAQRRGVCTAEALVLRPKLVEPRFLSYFILNRDLISVVDGSTYGSKMPRANWEFIGNLPALIPPIDEQRAIASFLDRETARIDALIAKKQRLIELLADIRAGMIGRCVVSGLDATTTLKDSGVDWLGHIPAHWAACSLKYIARIEYGLVLELDPTETNGTPILSLPHVTKDGRLVPDEVAKTPISEPEKRKLLLRKGDLLFNWRNGSPDHVGKTAYFDLDGEYAHVSFLLRLRFDLTRHEPRYFQYFLNNLRNTGFFGASKHQVNRTYNQTELGRLSVMVPPVDEQRAIAAHLHRETNKLDRLTAQVAVATAKLSEYRSALISAAVTGKIDVRND